MSDGRANPTYDFQTQRDMGERYEKTVLARVSEVLDTSIEYLSYESMPQAQLSGVDALTANNTGIDVKVQRAHHITTGNLPFEVWSDFGNQTPGWIYTGQSDLIVWAYCDKERNSLLETGYLMWKRDALIEWFNQHKDSFRRVTIDNDSYNAVVSLVPLITIPDNFLSYFRVTMPTDND